MSEEKIHMYEFTILGFTVAIPISRKPNVIDKMYYQTAIQLQRWIRSCSA